MRRSFLIAPALALTRCLFPSLDGLAGDASAKDASTEAVAEASPSDAPIVDAAPKTYVEEVTSDSPAGWWRLGEATTSSVAKDQTGGHDGKYNVPGVTLGLKGAIASDPDTAMAVDGVNGAMFLPGTLFDLGGAPAFAVEVWVSPGAPPPADASDTLRRIASHRSDSPYFGWYLAIDDTQRVLFERWDSNATVAAVTASMPLTQSQWAHVVLSADGTTLTLYVDGVQAGTCPEATITDTPANNVSFGSNSDLAGEFFDGAIDEPAIYTHALAPARVVAHYQAGIAK